MSHRYQHCPLCIAFSTVTLVSFALNMMIAPCRLFTQEPSDGRKNTQATAQTCFIGEENAPITCSHHLPFSVQTNQLFAYVDISTAMPVTLLE